MRGGPEPTLPRRTVDPALGPPTIDHRADRPTLDRRAHERRTPDLLTVLLTSPSTRVLDVAGDRVPATLVGPGRRGRLIWRDPHPVDVDESTPERHVFLGRDDSATAHVAALHAHVPADAPNWAGLREIGAWLDGADADAALTAVGLARWHARSGYCPACGAPTALGAAGWVRRCTAEGSEHFPRTDPAVIVAITDPADRLLLGRGPTFKKHWVSVLAGFVEPGETLEAAVAREMAEEVGLVLTDVTYVGSQPWPFPASLMLGFTARATTAQLRPDPVEIAEVDWYTRDRLATELAEGRLGIPGRLSIARRLIEDWYGGPVRQRREVGTIRTDAG